MPYDRHHTIKSLEMIVSVVKSFSKDIDRTDIRWRSQRLLILKDAETESQHRVSDGETMVSENEKHSRKHKPLPTSGPGRTCVPRLCPSILGHKEMGHKAVSTLSIKTGRRRDDLIMQQNPFPTVIGAFRTWVDDHTETWKTALLHWTQLTRVLRNHCVSVCRSLDKIWFNLGK